MLKRMLLVVLSMVFTTRVWSLPPENLPVLHGKVTYPVLQELMGGCSLRCAFSWETLGGNPLEPAPELCDDDATTGWMAPRDWQNSPIIFRMPKKLPADCRDTPLYGISIANGKIQSLQDFRSFARAKKMTLSVNHKAIARLQLADTWKWQDFHFDDILLNQGDFISLKIDEIYPGSHSQQPVITEIVLQGGH